MYEKRRSAALVSAYQKLVEVMESHKNENVYMAAPDVLGYTGDWFSKLTAEEIVWIQDQLQAQLIDRLQ